MNQADADKIEQEIQEVSFMIDLLKSQNIPEDHPLVKEGEEILADLKKRQISYKWAEKAEAKIKGK